MGYLEDLKTQELITDREIELRKDSNFNYDEQTYSDEHYNTDQDVMGGFNIVDDGYEIVESDNNSVLSYDDFTDGDIVLSDNSTNAVSIGFRCKVIQVNDGLITFQTSGSATLKSLNGAVETLGEGSMVDVIKISTNGWLISGDIS